MINKEKELICSINIVPFVDIILVVLITFMVATPYVIKHGIPLNLPKASGGAKISKSPFHVMLDKKGTLSLNGKKVSEEELMKKAKTLSKKNPLLQAVISADKDIPHGKVVRIIDFIRSSGILKFAITTDKTIEP